MSRSARKRARHLGLAVLAALLLGLWSSAALAEVRRVGEWPQTPKPVSLSVSGLPRTDAIKRLADEAGWSVVVQAPKSDPVTLHVKDQPATTVLELLLSDGKYVAKRTGTLIAIAPDTAPAAADEPVTGPSAADATPTAAPEAADGDTPAAADTAAADDAQRKATAEDEDEDEKSHERGEDRVVTGGSTKVGKNEVVHDLAVFGGSADVEGRVTGDVAVLGGSMTLRKDARVEGDAAALGGTLTMEDGSRIDGDVEVLGGRLVRGKNTHIGGDVTSSGDGHNFRLFDGGDAKRDRWSFASLVQDAGSALTNMALLFVFGAVLFGLATGRMERMQTEVAARPMRNFAYGVVGLLVAIVTTIALCITVIGIPVAIVGVLVAVFATYAGICAVLSAVGAALVQHKSSNPYAHLAVGCAVYLIAGSIPYLGGLVTLALVLVGIGVLVTTRGAGFIKPRKRPEGSGPYRRAAESV